MTLTDLDALLDLLRRKRVAVYELGNLKLVISSFEDAPVPEGRQPVLPEERGADGATREQQELLYNTTFPEDFR